MKLAIIGCCPDAAALANAALTDRRFAVVGVFAAPDADSVSLAQAPASVPRYDDWHRLLAGDEVDAVIVAGRTTRSEGDQTSNDEVLKLIVQAGLATIVVHPACDAIVAYELDMIRSDTGGVLVPYFCGIGHPLLDELRGWVDGSVESPVGRVEQIAAERTLPTEPARPLLDDFVRDVNRIRHILGDVDKVSGLGNAHAAAGPLTLSVNLTSRSGPLARWTVGTRRDQAFTTFLIDGSRGRAKLIVPDGPSAWRLAIPTDAEPDAEPDAAPNPAAEDWDGPRAALDRLYEAVRGPRSGPISPDSSSDPKNDPKNDPTWTDACRDLEVADSLTVSLRRGRTIQLHHEEHTEEGSFKGIMAVGGCAMLMVGLLVLVAFAVVEGFRMPRGRVVSVGGVPIGSPAPIARVDAQTPKSSNEDTAESRGSLVWRLWPVYPFAAFLLLQLLRLVFRADPRRSKSGRSDRQSADGKGGQDEPDHVAVRDGPR